MANGHENKSLVVNYFANFVQKYREERDGIHPSNESVIQVRGGQIRQYRSTKSEPINIQIREFILDQQPSRNVHMKSSEQPIDSQSIPSVPRPVIVHSSSFRFIARFLVARNTCR